MASEGAGVASAVRIPQRFLPSAGAASLPENGENVGERLPEQLASVCSELQALCLQGRGLAEELRLRGRSRYEGYDIALRGVRAAKQLAEAYVARLRGAKEGGVLPPPPPGKLAIAPGASASWALGRFGVPSLGDKGTASFPKLAKQKGLEGAPQTDETRPAPHHAVVVKPTGGAGAKRGAKKKAAAAVAAAAAPAAAGALPCIFCVFACFPLHPRRARRQREGRNAYSSDDQERYCSCVKSSHVSESHEYPPVT